MHRYSKTAVVANAMFHEQNEMQIREEQSRITSFEEAFQKIKEATVGCHKSNIVYP